MNKQQKLIESRNNLCESAVFEENQFSNIKISVISENVTIVTSNDNIIKVTIHSNLPDDECPKVKIENDTLYIVRETKRFHFGFFWNFFGEVEISVPKDFINKKNDNISIATISGSINAENLNGRTIHLSSTSGSINALLFSGDLVSLESKSGSVSIDDSKFSELSLESISGSTKCNNITSNRIRLSSSSGSVKCNYSSANQVELSGISGSVLFDGRCKTIEAKSVSGSVKIQNGVPFTDKVMLKSTSGSVHLSMPDNDGYALNFSTVSGSIHDSFTKVNTKGKGSYKYKDGNVEITAVSISGSIYIERY